MKKWTALGRAVAMGAILLCSAAAPGETADMCAVPGYLLFGDSLLNRVNAAVTKEKELKIVALGGVSSTLPGPDGPSFAYPARLEAALARRLPGVKVTVTTLTKTRQTAAEMAESIGKLLARPEAEFGGMANRNIRRGARHRSRRIPRRGF